MCCESMNYSPWKEKKIEKYPFLVQKRKFQLKFAEWIDITFATIQIFNRARASHNKRHKVANFGKIVTLTTHEVFEPMDTANDA